MILFLYRNFVEWASLGLITVIVLLSVVYIVVIYKTKNQYVIREMKTAADALLALASLLIFMPCVQYLLAAIIVLRSVGSADTGDTRIIMGGVAQELVRFIVGLSGFIVVYVIWGGLRLLQGRALNRLTQI